MTSVTLRLPDMHCASCAAGVRRALGDLAGVRALQVNPVRRQVLVDGDERLQIPAVLTAIEEAGFTPELESVAARNNNARRDLLKRLGVAGIACMQVMMAQGALYLGGAQDMTDTTTRLFQYTALAFCIPIVCYSAVPFYSSGLAVRRRGINRDTPIALAILLAFTASLLATVNGQGDTYYDSVAMFAFLLLGTRYVDARLRARLTVDDDLHSAVSNTAQRLDPDQPEAPPLTVPAAEVRAQDLLWIAEGAQLPADGVLIDPEAVLDEHCCPANSDWCRHTRGDRLHAGTFNRGAGFRMAVLQPLSRSRLAEIDRLAQVAQSDKHRLATLPIALPAGFCP